MALHLPKFTDQHPEFSASGYKVTNEEPALFNQLLGDIKVKRGACIASGGEVLLSVFMPRAKEVLAVDHSNVSLAATYLKVLLLQEIPFKVLTALLREQKYKELQARVEAVWDQLPIKKDAASFNKNLFTYDWANLRREWCSDGFKVPRVTKAWATRLQFLHGDLRDVKALHGTFDMFYASNAFEHSGRDHSYPTFKQFADLLNPGGLLLYSDSLPHTANRFRDAELELVNQVFGYRTNWHHTLARKRG